MANSYKLKSSSWTLLVCLAVAGCTSSGLEITDRGGGHGSFEGIELRLAGTEMILADWSIDNGWRDAEGEMLDALPPAVRVGATLEPLRAGGPPATLEVRFQSQDALDIAPLDDPDMTLENPCGEFSARYFPLDDNTQVIAWPNVPDPASGIGDRPTGPALFAKRANDELVQLFHCNQLHIYPERAGIAHLELLLWHVNHADQASDALPVQVLDSL